jgi:hypothetical protein
MDAVHIVAEELDKYVSEAQNGDSSSTKTKEYWRQERNSLWCWWGKSTQSTELTAHPPFESDLVSVFKFVTPAGGNYIVDNFG